jgi:arginyl-tRNA synthetase
MEKMKTIIDILNDRVSAVMGELAGGTAQAAVRPTQDARFGDYQANGVMGLAKQLKAKPRDLAQKIVEKLDVADMCEPPEIAGPGFINFRLKPAWLAERLIETARDEKRLGIDPIENPPTTVVDFSGPNIAKQMHVGHLRSTIIGDVIARTLEFRYGDPKTVIRQNHVGDWGTQFGMLTAYYDLVMAGKFPDIINLPDKGSFLADMEEFYKRAKTLFDKSHDFQESARNYVVLLQSGDPNVLENWKYLVNESLSHCEEIYSLLSVTLKRSDVRGESFYNDKLPAVISDLDKAGLLKPSEGANCVFLEGFKTKEGEPLPLIVQKSDGAYLYATTDLAAIRYRIDELKAKRIIYVTDARQKLHFEMIFACARQAGWVDESIRLEHVPFGSVLGEDGKPFKTRSGENVKLKDLLDEAVSRARKIVEEKNPDLPEDDKNKIAAAVGVGAVKYADLSNNLASDYVFDWDRMLAMEGNTAPYMQYAYARIQSIFRRGEVSVESIMDALDHLELVEPEELNLAKCLLRYGETVESVADDLRPHVMTNYLFDLAQNFSNFYTHCPVLKAEDRVRARRLLLCQQTARTIRHGLEILGIETPPQM